MVLESVVELVLVLASGLVLGYLLALPRVKRLERELAQELRKDHYLDLRKDSRLAQERSLQLLHQKEKESE
jgi:hypothetical protein